MGSYRFLDHTADIAFEVRGLSLEELFTSSAFAWKESVAEEFPPGNTSDSRRISLKEDSAEELLVGFLSELNFLLSAKKWIMNSIEDIRVTKADNALNLEVSISGEHFDPERHKLKEEIKAVTFHQMKIVKNSDEFSTIVVFDI